MYLHKPHDHSRRAFLKRSTQLAFTGTALPIALNLAAMGEAAAFTAPANSYKALVCVFLYGGNDQNNTFVPYDTTSYNSYRSARGGSIALPRAAVAPNLLRPLAALPNGQQFALHPSMTGMAKLFNAGQAAVQLNVGPLIVPMTRVQYESGNRATYPAPPKLFSHNDQQSVWQSSAPEGSTRGWGGAIGDLALSSNGTSLFTCISVTGNAVFLAGGNALAYQVSPEGAVAINGIKGNPYGSVAVKSAIGKLTQQKRNHVLENAYNTVTQRAVAAEVLVSGAVASGAAAGTGAEFAAINAALPGNDLAGQLKMVARMVAARSGLGSRRQVFLVSLGGFDTHDGLLKTHEEKLKQVDSAMTAFHQTMEKMNMAQNVTAFTASDFGRTLTSNGNGTDHGWGSHHMMVGGAVKGQAFYGTAPPLSVGDTAAPQDQWHVGQGRLLPSTSVSQYAATLARWFGVADTELNGILPDLRNFGGAGYPRDLGFMKA